MLSGCWCDLVLLFKAIIASLYQGYWFSSTNRLRITPWGPVTLTPDCKKGKLQLCSLCLSKNGKHTQFPCRSSVCRSDRADTVVPAPRTSCGTVLTVCVSVPAHTRHFLQHWAHVHWRVLYEIPTDFISISLWLNLFWELNLPWQQLSVASQQLWHPVSFGAYVFTTVLF